jgi:hypothetical protein
MRRKLLVLTLVFVAVFATTYAVTWAIGNALAVAVFATFGAGLLWVVSLDVRRTPWPAEGQRSHDAVYMAAAFAALHAPAQGGADCSPGFDGGFGGADCGGFGT